MNFGTLCHTVRVWGYRPFSEEECLGAFFVVCCQSPFFVENCIHILLFSGLGRIFFCEINFGTLCHIVKVWRYGPFNEEECRGAFFAVCCQSPFFVENL